MTSRRALIPLNDLRRCAKVAREEGVSVNVSRAADGIVTIVVQPAPERVGSSGDDLDGAMERFLGT